MYRTFHNSQKLLLSLDHVKLVRGLQENQQRKKFCDEKGTRDSRLGSRFIQSSGIPFGEI